MPRHWSSFSHKVGALLVLFILAATIFVAAAPVGYSQDVYGRAPPKKSPIRRASINIDTASNGGQIASGTPSPTSPSHPSYGNSMCPSVQEFINVMTTTMSSRPNAPIVFYSRPAAPYNAYLHAEKVQGWYYTSLGGTDLSAKWAGACDNNPVESNKVTIRISVALATLARGTAWVVTSGKPKETSIWTMYELPTLQKNLDVKEIKEYSLTTRQETTLWKRGQPEAKVHPIP